MVKNLWLTLCVGAAVVAPIAAVQKNSPKGVATRDVNGWKGSHFFSSGRVETAIVPAIGGRVTQYGFKGENILFEVPESFGKVLGESPNFSVGGYQCDVGPELRIIPDHPELWMGPWQSAAAKDYTVRVVSKPDETLGLQLEKEIMVDPKTGELGIVQRLKNVSSKVASYCLWDRTLCKGGGYALFPLNKKSRFTAGWSIRKTVNGKYVYDGTNPGSASVKILDGVLVAKAEGEATKVGADSDAGWIAYARGKTLFVKYFPYFPGAPYTDGGNSVELYFDPRVAELEPLSPEMQMGPHTDYTFPEKWVLIPLKKEVASHEEARELVKLIPPSPFEQ